MGKEIKIGLAVIGVLLCVFGGVLFFRLRREAPDSAQRKVAAAKKDGKAKSDKKDGKTKPDKKETTKPEKPKEERYNHSPGKAAWGTPDGGDPQTETTNVDNEQAPVLDTSPYRDRSEGARGGRYGKVPSTDDPLNKAGSEETTPDEIEDESQLTELSMPEDRFAERRPGGAFAREAFSQEELPEEQVGEGNQIDPVDAGESDPLASAQEDDQVAMDRAVDPSRRGDELMEGQLDAADEAEDGGEAIQLSPLVDDESEVRPAANDRYAKGRYQRDETDSRRLDRSKLGHDGLQHDQLDRNRDALAHEPELADETQSGDSEPDDERPVQHRLETGSYVVEPNDNFWRISQKVYGTGAYFKALEEHNRRQQGDKRLINVGDVLAVPDLAVLRDSYPDLCPRPRNVSPARETVLTSASGRGARGSRTYTVAEGDTLFDIARNELGKASRWADIYQLNREQLGDDFNYLSPGMQLVLPERQERVDPIASRPRRDGYRR